MISKTLQAEEDALTEKLSSLNSSTRPLSSFKKCVLAEGIYGLFCLQNTFKSMINPIYVCKIKYASTLALRDKILKLSIDKKLYFTIASYVREQKR